MFLPVVVFFAELSLSSLSLLTTVISLLVASFKSSFNSCVSLVIPDHCTRGWSSRTWLALWARYNHSIDNNYNERHFMPVKFIIKRDAYMCDQWLYVTTIIIILLQHLYKVVIVYLNCISLAYTVGAKC